MRIPRWSIPVLTLLLVVSCAGGPTPEEAQPPTTAVAITVESVLADSSAAMREVETVRFRIERTGAEVFIDGGGAVRFDAAEGRYAAPASADALLDVQALGFATQVGAVAIEGETWITNPVTGAWEPAPPDLDFDPATLFDDQVGFPSLLADGLQDPALSDTEPDAEGRYHVRGTVDSQRISTLTSGLADEETEVDIWIDAETGLVAEVRFDVETDDGPTTWRLTLSDYGADVTIEPPDLPAG